MPYTASEYARYWTVAFFQKVAFLKIKYAVHPVSLENRLETLPQTYAYPGQSLCRCKTLAAELIQMFERARRLYQMLERYGRSEIILSTSAAVTSIFSML